MLYRRCDGCRYAYYEGPEVLCSNPDTVCDWDEEEEDEE